MKTRLKYIDKRFDVLDIGTSRSMRYQLIFIDTPKYQHCIGANGHWYTRSDMIGNMPEKRTKMLLWLLINGYGEEVSWENYT